MPPAAAPLRRKINLLTGDDFAPFTSKAAHNGGLITEVMNAAMTQAAPAEGYAIHWVGDWSSHLDPLLSNALLDAGFPWYKPDCAAMPDSDRCRNLHFSEPMFETLMLLFADKRRPFRFQQDSDIEGKTLCRPAGYFTHDLNRPDRQWLDRGRITLVQPQTPADCFRMVAEGRADAVAVNLFLGASTLVAEGLREVIVPLEKPLSEEGLHVVISKRHWRGTTHLYRINAGLQALRDSGRFEEIMSRQLELFWAQLQ